MIAVPPGTVLSVPYGTVLIVAIDLTQTVSDATSTATSATTVSPTAPGPRFVTVAQSPYPNRPRKPVHHRHLLGPNLRSGVERPRLPPPAPRRPPPPYSLSPAARWAARS